MLVPRLLTALLGLLTAVGVLSLTDTRSAEAVTGADWNPGRIIDDGAFFQSGALTEQQIANVITAQGANCSDTTVPCLKNYSASTPATPAEAGLCQAMPAGSGLSAAAIIHRIAQACGISPKVMLVMIQKESGLVATRTPTASMYRTTTGFACPDTAPCDSQYFGFFNQVYRMARQFQVYTTNPTRYGYQAGRDNTILYHPNTACGSSSVYIQNQATANLYIYTPYQPNQAALDNLYGEGDSCSAYGNRNFWRLYSDWFEATTPPPTRAPIGNYESATASGASVTLTGWTLDRDSPAVSGHVAVYRNGTVISWFAVDRLRADVNAAYGVSGNHGFNISLSNQPSGTHSYCVFAIDNEQATTNPSLGCRTVTVTPPPTTAPIGRFDSASAVYQSVTLTGWTLDHDSPATAGQVAIARNGAQLGTYPVDRLRADVNAAYGVSGNHGFNISLPNQPSGTHSYCVFAIDNEQATTNPSLGCRTVTVTPPPTTAPIGRFDSASAVYQSVTLTGWTLDHDSPTVSGHVAVYRDGVGISWFGVDRLRADVNAAYGVSGNHGFNISLANQPAGTHSYCVMAIDNERVTTNPLLGCRTVTVTPPPTTAPIGRVDSATVSGKNVRLTGWTLDHDSPTVSGHVAVYRDGVGISWFGVDRLRADVNAAYGVSGNHGFNISLANQPAGTHSYCVMAIDNERVTTNPLLACRSVTIN